MKLRFFFSAHRLIVVYISTKFHENIQDGIKVIQCFTFLSKQLINLINTHIKYTLSVPAFGTKVVEYDRLYRADTIFIRKKLKGHNSIQTVGGVSVLVLCIWSDGGLY